MKIVETSFDNAQPLWTPSDTYKQQANVTHYMHWLAVEKGLHFLTREELWQWSVDELEAFWASLWDYFQIQASQPYTTILAQREMPGADWFPGARLNYAEHVFRDVPAEKPALLFRSERHELVEITWGELQRQVGAVAQSLRTLGVERGDRVVAYLPNIPESIIAFLACASIGATWSSCAPDFGINSVIDRFKQIDPCVLIAVDGYQYNGKPFDRRPVISALQAALPTLQHTIVVTYLFDNGAEAATSIPNTIPWSDLLLHAAELIFAQLPFNHPLWVLYSSGTTGLPKAIVQGQGGILLEHLKALALDADIKASDRFFWFSTTGWMMWNFLVSSLLTQAVALLYDGSPAYPHLNTLWQFAQDSEMTFFGTSAGYITSCMKAGITPGQNYNLHALRAIGSTGSPLPPEGFEWIYQQVKPDIWLASISGGTDVCSAFVTGSVILPVYAGELQCRSLGARVEAFSESGEALIDEVGELVLTAPMPSMPLFFWNDPDMRRYQDSYFATYPGIWRHGDWIKITTRGSAVIYGRSDSTINRMGIRMGSSEIYRAVEALPEVVDSLVIGVEQAHGHYYMPLFVVLQAGVGLDETLKRKINTAIRNQVSPHHVPDEILVITEVPRTLSGKKLEVPVKRILLGLPLEKVMSLDALSNPEAMQPFLALAKEHSSQQPTV